MRVAKFAVVTILFSLVLVLPGCGSKKKGGFGDDFSAITIITSAPGTASGNTTTATSDVTDPTPTCGAGITSNSVWVQYTTSSNDTIIADTVGSDYDTVLSVWTGSPGSFASVTCNDDDLVSLTLQSRVVFAGASGTTYNFMISAFKGDGGNLVFNLDLRTPPANDDFANIAVAAAVPFSSSVNTEGATVEASDPVSLCDNGLLATPTVWYQYTPVATETVTAHTDGSNYDTVLSVWTGSPGSLSPVACNDDGAFNASSGTSAVTFTATGGVTYQFMVSSFWGDGGTLAFNLSSVAGMNALQLPANDLVYDPFTRNIYASLPGSTPDGNSIVPIEPVTGTVGTPVFIGSEPEKLALSANGQALYVALDGGAAVRRFDVASQTAPEPQFSLGNDPFLGAYYAGDMDVLPGNPGAIAVSLKTLQTTGSGGGLAGVAVFENGVQRPGETPVQTGSSVLEFSETGAALYGYNDQSAEIGFLRMTVEDGGVTVGDVTKDLISGSGIDIEYDSGRIYTTNGQVIDSAAPALLGTFPNIPPGSLVVPDSSVGRVFFLTPSPTSGDAFNLIAFDPVTFARLDSILLTGVEGTPESLIRWGQDGLAFRTSGGQVYLIRGNLVLAPPSADDAVPELSVKTTNALAVGGSNFYLTVHGTGFGLDSVALWNGQQRHTIFVSSNELRVAIPAADIALPGAAQITVFNAAAGGGISPPLNVTIR